MHRLSKKALLFTGMAWYMRCPWTKPLRTSALTAVMMLLAGILFSASALALDAQAVVDRTHIRLSDTLRLDVIVKGGKADVDVSVIRDFKILSQGTSSRVRIVNTKYSRETTYQFVLLPLKEGLLTIPPLNVAGGKSSIYTRPIRIQVSADSGSADADRDLWVEATVSNADPVEGEQIVYTFRLYQAVDIDQAQLRPPDFDGFSSTEIEDQASQEKVIDGRRYGVKEQSYLLTPLKTGDIDIGPAMLTCDILLRRRARRSPYGGMDSLFDDPFFNPSRREKKVLRTGSLSLHIAPLPPSKDRIPFSGLIGHADFSALIEDNELAVGDSTTLTLTIEGRGNIMDTEVPGIRLPEDNFKVYRDAPATDVKLTPDGYSGKKIFRIALVPLKEGQYIIPPVRFKYYDTDIGDYKVITSHSLAIQARPSQETPAPEMYPAPRPALNAAGSDKKDVIFTGHDILPLKENPGKLSSRNGMSWLHFAIWVLVSALMYPVVVIATRLKRKTPDSSRQMAMKAKKALKDAAKPGIDGETFLALLYKAMTAAICALASHGEDIGKGASLTHVEAEKILREKGLADDDIERTLELFKRIESARYSGSEVDRDLQQSLLSDTRRMIGRLSL